MSNISPRKKTKKNGLGGRLYQDEDFDDSGEMIEEEGDNDENELKSWLNNS